MSIAFDDIKKLYVPYNGASTEIKQILRNGVVIWQAGFSFKYSGSCTLNGTACTPNTQYDTDGDWQINFLTSGTLTVINEGTDACDVYTLGGGGGLCHVEGGWLHNVGGGGGGYVANVTSVTLSSTYSIVIGAGGAGKYSGDVADQWFYASSGGASSISGSGVSLSSSGGHGGEACSGALAGYVGSNGGSGGSGGGACQIGASDCVGGANGADGVAGASQDDLWHKGTGQHVNTGPFNTASNIYAHGGDTYTGDCPVDVNTGAAGTCKMNWNYIDGRSGLVCLRNHRS